MGSKEPRMFTATKAFIINKEGKILILRESPKYVDGANISKYDVVGGRVKPGQRFDDSLIREVSEETGIEIKIGKPFFVNEWRPIVKDEPWQIVGIFFECFPKSEEVKLSDDHDDYLWIDPDDYKNYNLIENLYPAFESYLNRIKISK